jgi:hypothetical protein
MDAIQRLETFLHGHKARSVFISHDNGYGAACWLVELATEAGPGESGAVSVGEVELMNWEDRDDWPGLTAVIHAAVDKAERLIAEKAK